MAKQNAEKLLNQRPVIQRIKATRHLQQIIVSEKQRIRRQLRAPLLQKLNDAIDALHQKTEVISYIKEIKK